MWEEVLGRLGVWFEEELRGPLSTYFVQRGRRRESCWTGGTGRYGVLVRTL